MFDSTMYTKNINIFKHIINEKKNQIQQKEHASNTNRTEHITSMNNEVLFDCFFKHYIIHALCVLNLSV